MNYEFNDNVLFSEKYTKEEFKTIVSFIPNKKLRYPIQRNSKRFRREIRGFRANRLPKEMLFDIYFNSIFIKKEFTLMKHVEEFLKGCIKVIYKKIGEELGVPSKILEKVSGNDMESFGEIVSVLLKTPFQKDILLFFKVIGHKLTAEQVVYCEKELPQKIEIIKKEQAIRKELSLDFNKRKQQLEMKFNEGIEEKEKEISKIKVKLDLTEKDYKEKNKKNKTDIKELTQAFELLKKQHQVEENLWINKDEDKAIIIEGLEEELNEMSNEIKRLNEVIRLKQEEFNIIAEKKWLEENENLIQRHENKKLTINALDNKYTEVSKEIDLLIKEKDFLKNKIKSLKNESISYIKDIKKLMKLINYNESDNQSAEKIHRTPSIKLAENNNVIIDNIRDYIDDLADNLNASGIGNEYALSVAEYIYASIANNMGLLLIGYNSRKIADSISSLTCGMSADIISVPLGFNNSGELISSVNNSKSKVILLENVVDNISEFVYLPLIKQNTDKILMFSMESEEHTHILSNSLLHYLTVINIDPVLEFNNQSELYISETEEHVFELEKNIDRRSSRDLENLDEVIQLSKVTKYKMNRMLNTLRLVNAADPLFNLIKYSILLIGEQNNKMDELNQYIEGLNPETANKLQVFNGVRL